MNFPFKINHKVIETERLIIRPFKATDLDDFFEYAKVDGVGEMAGWSHHKDKEESLQILNLFIKEDETFAIVLKENNKVIGSIGVKQYSEEDCPELEKYKGRELGYALSKDYWGRGLMPEAIKSIIDYLLNEVKLDFILCGHYLFNLQSKRVQEKCGFTFYKENVYHTRMDTYEPGIINIIKSKDF